MVDAWETEDGTVAVVNPDSMTEVGAAIIDLWGPELVEEMIGLHDYSVLSVPLDPNSPSIVGYYVWVNTDMNTCVWFVPDDLMSNMDEGACAAARKEGSIITGQSWWSTPPEGYTRVVWAEL